MASPVSVGDGIAVLKLCVNLVRYIKEVKNAPVEYESSVTTLNKLGSTFEVLNASSSLSEGQRSLPYSTAVSDADYRLAQEVQAIHDCLVKATKILGTRYEGKGSISSMIQVGRLVKQMRWRSTRRDFEAQLEMIDRSLRHVDLLLEVKNLNLNYAIKQSVTALAVELNQMPPSMGLPGSGGGLENHVRLDNGLGISTILIFDICSDPERMHRYFEIMFEQYPGRQRIRDRQYKLYCTNFRPPVEVNLNNWETLVRPGSSLNLAFVVGIYRPRFRSSCPACNSKYRGEPQFWHSCQCGRSFYAGGSSEGGSEQQQDCLFAISTDTHDDQLTASYATKSGQVDTSRSVDNQVVDNTIRITTDKQQKAAEARYSEELYYRSVVVQFDPLLRIVYSGSIACQILWLVTAQSRSAITNRVDRFTVTDCPRHGKDVAPNLSLEVLNAKCYYDVDHYFRRFGSCQRFLGYGNIHSDGQTAKNLVEFESLVV